MIIKSIAPIWSMLTCLTSFGQDSFVSRTYQLGDVYRYQLTLTELHNNAFHKEAISVCEITVVRNDKGELCEQIRWLKRTVTTPEDTTIQDTLAVSVPTYQISIQPDGHLDLPSIEVPEMTQPMQDLNTFFVAVSPQLGTTKLQSKGDSILEKDMVVADLSNNDFILKGADCFVVKIKMKDLTKDSIFTRVDFLPPSAVCFPYYLSEMQTPVVDGVMNNIQMVMDLGAGKCNVQFGREMFYIDAATSRSDGKLLHATMSNTLNLMVKVYCDMDYQNCQGKLPFTIKRELKLELLPDQNAGDPTTD